MNRHDDAILDLDNEMVQLRFKTDMMIARLAKVKQSLARCVMPSHSSVLESSRLGGGVETECGEGREQWMS